LQHWIGLALLARGPERIGETVTMVDFMRSATVEAEVCSPGFRRSQGGAAACLNSCSPNCQDWSRCSRRDATVQQAQRRV